MILKIYDIINTTPIKMVDIDNLNYELNREFCDNFARKYNIGQKVPGTNIVRKFIVGTGCEKNQFDNIISALSYAINPEQFIHDTVCGRIVRSEAFRFQTMKNIYGSDYKNVDPNIYPLMLNILIEDIDSIFVANYNPEPNIDDSFRYSEEIGISKEDLNGCVNICCVYDDIDVLCEFNFENGVISANGDTSAIIVRNYHRRTEVICEYFMKNGTLHNDKIDPRTRLCMPALTCNYDNYDSYELYVQNGIYTRGQGLDLPTYIQYNNQHNVTCVVFFENNVVSRKNKPAHIKFVYSYDSPGLNNMVPDTMFEENEKVSLVEWYTNGLLNSPFHDNIQMIASANIDHENQDIVTKYYINGVNYCKNLSENGDALPSYVSINEINYTDENGNDHRYEYSKVTGYDLPSRTKTWIGSECITTEYSWKIHGNYGRLTKNINCRDMPTKMIVEENADIISTTIVWLARPIQKYNKNCPNLMTFKKYKNTDKIILEEISYWCETPQNEPSRILTNFMCWSKYFRSTEGYIENVSFDKNEITINVPVTNDSNDYNIKINNTNCKTVIRAMNDVERKYFEGMRDGKLFVLASLIDEYNIKVA